MGKGGMAWRIAILKVRRRGSGRPHGYGKRPDDGRSLAALRRCGGGDCRRRLATRPPRPDPDDDQVAGLGGGDQPEDDRADGGGQVRFLQIKKQVWFYKNVFLIYLLSLRKKKEQMRIKEVVIWVVDKKCS